MSAWLIYLNRNQGEHSSRGSSYRCFLRNLSEDFVASRTAAHREVSLNSVGISVWQRKL